MKGFYDVRALDCYGRPVKHGRIEAITAGGIAKYCTADAEGVCTAVPAKGASLTVKNHSGESMFMVVNYEIDPDNPYVCIEVL